MSPRGRVFAIDRLTTGYLGITGLYALVFGGSVGVVIAGIHLVVIGGIGLARWWTPERGFAAFVRVAYPTMLMPFMYRELARLNRFITEGTFDGVIQGWESAVFGYQPSVDWSSMFPSLLLSEALHLGYMSYYLLMPMALGAAFFASGRRGAHRAAFTLMSAFYVCYAFFIAFPVAGPRYEYVRIGGPLADGSLYAIVHDILESGSSKGTAFPSSHVAASLAVVLAASREDRRWLWALIVPEAALIVGTVYGRFHYAIDALVGLGFGVGVWLAAPSLMRLLGGDGDRGAADAPAP